MKKTLLFLAVSSFLSAHAQWIPFDTADVKVGEIRSIGSSFTSDSVLIFSKANNMYVYNFSNVAYIDSVWNGGLGNPPYKVLYNSNTGSAFYCLYNGFGSPGWLRRNTNGTTTGINGSSSGHLNDKMNLTTQGVLFYKKNSLSSLLRSTNEGTSYTTAFTSSIGCGLVGVSANGAAFVSIGTQVSGNVVTFDSAALYRSIDGGVTWSIAQNHNTSDSIRRFNRIDCIGSDCYAIATLYKFKGSVKNDAFFYSSDHGATWSLQGSMNKDGLNEYNWGVDKVGNVYYADGGNAYRSTDKGATFSQYMGGLHSGAFVDGIFSVFGKLFLTADGKLYKTGTAALGAEENLAVNNSHLVYPSVTKGILNIQSVNGEKNEIYNLQNLLGEVVLGGSTTSQQTQVDLAGLPSGLYVLRIGKTGAESYKIVKE